MIFSYYLVLERPLFFFHLHLFILFYYYDIIVIWEYWVIQWLHEYFVDLYNYQYANKILFFYFGPPHHQSKKCPKLNQILFEAVTWSNIWNQYGGENVTEQLYDLSLHPDQYYILVSETNYPCSQCTAHSVSRCWNALPLCLAQLISNHT